MFELGYKKSRKAGYQAGDDEGRILPTSSPPNQRPPDYFLTAHGLAAQGFLAAHGFAWARTRAGANKSAVASAADTRKIWILFIISPFSTAHSSHNLKTEHGKKSFQGIVNAI